MNKAFDKILDSLRKSVDKECVSSVPKVRLCDAIKIVQEAEEEYNGGWIPVSERLPEESLNSVIGWDAYRKRCVFVQYIQGQFQIMGSVEIFDIKAWTPLPEPYKED